MWRAKNNKIDPTAIDSGNISPANPNRLYKSCAAKERLRIELRIIDSFWPISADHDGLQSARNRSDPKSKADCYDFNLYLLIWIKCHELGIEGKLIESKHYLEGSSHCVGVLMGRTMPHSMS